MVNNLTSHSTAKPFDEFNLTAQQITQKADKLLRKGYCSIHMSEITHALFNDISKSADGWKTNVVLGEQYSFVGTEYNSKISDCVQKLLFELTNKQYNLEPNENELRKPPGIIAMRWHHDTSPKLMTVAATHEGKGTEFVSLEVADTKFEPMKQTSLYQPIKGEKSIAPDIQVAKDKRFYMFAGDGLKDPKIPKFLHRANGDEERTIFLARFQEARNK